MIDWRRAVTFGRRRAVREGSLVLLDQGLLSIATFLSGILLAKATNQEAFGVYVLAWSLFNISLSFTDALVNKPFAIKLKQQSAQDMASYQASCLFHTAVLALAGGSLLFILLRNSTFSAEHNSTLLLPTIIFFSLLPYLIRGFLRSAALAHLHVREGVAANVIGSLTQIAVICALYLLDYLSVGSVYIAIGLGCLIAIVSMIHQQRSLMAFQSRKLVSDFKNNWRIGRWLPLNAFSFSIVSQAYPWLFILILDARSVAIFGACQSIAVLMAPLLRGMNAYILPRMTHGLHDKGEKGLFRILKASTIALSIPTLLWTIIATAIADPLMKYLYTEEYAGTGGLLFLLLLRTLIDSASTPTTNALQTLGKAKHTAMAGLAGSAVTLAAGPYLIYQFGILGAGLSALLASLVIAGMKWHWILKIAKTI